MWRHLRLSLRNFYHDDMLTYGAALAFFFLLSLFPLLIFLASALAYLSTADLFGQIVGLMALVVPAPAMNQVEAVLREILRTNLGLLSSGFLGALWAASIGFDALINALNVAFSVQERRPFWRRRLLAVGLTVVVGALIIVALAASLLGPWLGSVLPRFLGVQSLFVAVWPYVQWTAVFLFLVLSFQILYFVAPNHRHSFWGQAPGALLAVALWIGASVLLSAYMSRFAAYNRIYGALGAVIVLMMWFYVTALAILLGAELSAELVRHRRARAAGPA